MIIQLTTKLEKKIEELRSRLIKIQAILDTAVDFSEEYSSAVELANQEIEELIHELKNEYTIAIVTHNMQQAARVSDYTAYMYLGSLIEYGKTDEIFIKPKRKETEDYITGRFG
mgnify:CR=1 FL=1